MRSRSAIALFCVAILILLQLDGAVSIHIPTHLQQGPFVEKAVFRVFRDNTSRIQALQSGEVDMDSGFVDISDVSLFESDPNLEIYDSPRNGYGHITFNCARYPFNISGFRRAFAFAFNKTKVVHDFLDGYASLHDSLVPSVQRWCAEDLLEHHYYDARPEIGNAILDELGFTLNNATGYRETPNGNPLSVEVLYHTSIPTVSGSEITELAVDALNSLHISASHSPVAMWYEHYWFPPWNNDFDMIFYETDFVYDSLDWLVRGFGSEYSDNGVPVGYSEHSDNFPNFSNDTFDTWIDQLENGKTYEEVYEAAMEMQRILHYNVPRFVVYENLKLQGYRSDRFVGHVGDLQQYVSGLWTLRNLCRIDGIQGETVRVALDMYLYDFGLYTFDSNSKLIQENLYSSLFSRGPRMNPIPNLAESISAVVVSYPNSSSNHLQYTIDIIQNATWSDGKPLTANDVAFTFDYLKGTLADYPYANPYAIGLDELVSAYAHSLYTVVLEFSSESYWHFSNFAYHYIIPKHIYNATSHSHWQSVGKINVWSIDGVPEPLVTCGPFRLTYVEPEIFYELSANPNFHYYPDFGEGPCPYPPPSRTTTPPPLPMIVSIPVMIATASTVSLVAFGIAIKKGWIPNKTN